MSNMSSSVASRTPPSKHRKGDRSNRPIPPTRTVTANQRSDSFSGSYHLLSFSTLSLAIQVGFIVTFQHPIVL